ncbi:MAG: hypothetical protein JW779_13375 [Candidatus Thorarchaeota archaeon]|nr:hypothetical protein [Candidatus Thorarchaeota archaeon]
MVRLTTIGNFLSGLGLASLAFTVVVKAIATQPDQVLYPLYIWLIALGFLVVVLAISVVNTFTEITGFVHPDDKMISNMLVYIHALATLLVYGLLTGVDVVMQGYLFDMGTMIVIAYVFLFIFMFFGSRISQDAETGKVKEMTSRFMLISLLLGVVLAGAYLLMSVVKDSLEYSLAAGVLMVFAVALVSFIVVFLGYRYEPVGE